MTTPAIDPSALRQYYLQQLGVTVYVSRGIADATEVLVPELEMERTPIPTGQVPVADAVIAAPVPVMRVSLTSNFDDEPVVAKPAAVTQPAVKQVATVADVATAPAMAPFQLLFAVVDARLAVAIQIPVLAKPSLPDAEARLLHNLLRWLGAPQPGAAWLNFRWPLPGLPAGSAAAAGKSLAVFLQQATSTHQCRHVLVLGQGPSQCLQQGDRTSLAPLQCWLTHGLSEMLSVPALKREVWQQLQPLHAQLL